MKKVLIMVAAVALTAIACKKDRDCSCKTYTTYNGAGATSSDNTFTMKKVSRKTAMGACLHTKETYTTTGIGNTVVTVDQDENCELK